MQRAFQPAFQLAVLIFQKIVFVHFCKRCKVISFQSGSLIAKRSHLPCPKELGATVLVAWVLELRHAKSPFHLSVAALVRAMASRRLRKSIVSSFLSSRASKKRSWPKILLQSVKSVRPRSVGQSVGRPHYLQNLKVTDRIGSDR